MRWVQIAPGESVAAYLERQRVARGESVMPGDTRGYAKPGTDESPAPTGLKAPKLPKNIVPLPDDTPESVWKQWPRYVEARVFFPQIRERNLTAKVTSGQLPCYFCPDGSARLNRDHLVALWGEPSEPAPNPLSAAGRALRGDDGKREPRPPVDLELDDPVVGMFRECREMLRQSNDFNLQLIKALMAPISEQLGQLVALCDKQKDRIEHLELRHDDVLTEREALADFRHERQLESDREKAREGRRGQVVELLRQQLPIVVRGFAAGGETLADFVADLDPSLVETVLQSGLLPKRREEQLRAVREQLQRQQQAKATPVDHSQSNGAASAPKPGDQAS